MDMEWWQSYPWHWWANLFFGEKADPAYDQTLSQIDFIEKSIPLNKNQKILDLACGNGRHAIELTKRGYATICFDYSQPILDIAKEKAQKINVNLEILQGDMRETQWNKEFDVVLNLFQSLGYFKTDEEDKKVLSNVFTALKDGGKFLLDVRNPDYIFPTIKKGNNAALKPCYPIHNRGSLKVKEEVVEPNIWKVTFDWQMGGSVTRNYWTHVRLYNLNELTQMFEEEGFSIEKVWGDYDGSEYQPEISKRLIILAKKSPS
jgi:SAM-dependent methyltransferase